MNSRLPKQIKLIPISEAAKILGVSIDTVRRWDKSGILHSERPDGKNRYFSQDELEKHKVGQPLPISEAAKELGISATTLRRLETRNLIKPIRNSAGERVYTKDSLNEFLNSHYSLRQRKVQEEESEPQFPKKLERPNLKPRSIMPHFLTITAALFLLLVTIAVGNIKLSEVKSSHPLPTSSVLSKTEEIKPKTEEVKPKIILTVKIDDSSATSSAQVNIREKPTTASKKIGQARDGDTFEFVSFDSGWYGVKLATDSAGFISTEYVVTEENK